MSVNRNVTGPLGNSAMASSSRRTAPRVKPSPPPCSLQTAAERGAGESSIVAPARLSLALTLWTRAASDRRSGDCRTRHGAVTMPRRARQRRAKCGAIARRSALPSRCGRSIVRDQMAAGVRHVVGRTTEQAIVAAFVGARGPGVLEIVCDAGSGKTTLWESALAAKGPRFLIARPSGAEATLSLSTVADLLSGLSARRLQRLPAPQRRLLGALLLLDEPSEPAPEPRALAVACLTALRQLADERPVVVAIDDFHWADPASASILAFVARRLPDASVRFLLTLRADQGA